MFVSRFVFLSVFFICVSVSAEVSLRVEGEWKQGAMLRGQVTPGSRVVVLDKKPFIDPRGYFVFGLGRDTSAKVSIAVVGPEGVEQQHYFDVIQREYPTQRIEGVAKKYVAPPAEVQARIKREAGQVWQARQGVSETPYYSQGFTWPLIGPITGVYGSQRVFNGVPKRPHYGLDIAGPVGATVYAPAAGKVTLAHDDMYYSGGTLLMDHGHGVSSTFIHLSKILVNAGEYVDQGDPIAEVGATGRVTGPHLDWRINWFNQRLDPHLLLPSMPELGK